MFIPGNAKVLKCNDKLAMICLLDVPSGVKRSMHLSAQFTKNQLNTKWDQRDIDELWGCFHAKNTSYTACDYTTGSANGTYFNYVVMVKVADVREKCPGWIVLDPAEALRKYSEHQGMDKNVELSSEVKELGAKAWAMRLRELGELSKSKEHMKVVCDGTHAVDLEL